MRDLLVVDHLAKLARTARVHLLLNFDLATGLLRLMKWPGR